MWTTYYLLNKTEVDIYFQQSSFSRLDVRTSGVRYRDGTYVLFEGMVFPLKYL
jgi:hypothetical protein